MSRDIDRLVDTAPFRSRGVDAEDIGPCTSPKLSATPLIAYTRVDQGSGLGTHLRTTGYWPRGAPAD